MIAVGLKRKRYSPRRTRRVRRAIKVNYN